MPEVAIIIVNWNGSEDTIACLRSLRRVKSPSFETIVVDNGSTDNSVERIRAEFPEVRLVLTGENLGFVGGNNLGLEVALKLKAKYALLLNNDTEVDENFLYPLVEIMESDPTVGVVGPTILYYKQPDLIWSAGGKVDWRRGKTAMIGLNESDMGQYGIIPREVDFISGCALMVRMDLVEKIGMLDERFFMYYEETEWCTRIKRKGYKILHIPTAKIWHKISLETRDNAPYVVYYMTRNRLLFLQLSKTGLSAWLFTLFFDYCRTLLSWSLRPKWRYKRMNRKAMIKGMGDYFSRKFGGLSSPIR